MSRRANARRGERAFIAIYAAVILVIPILFTEIYPFSAYPLFADAPRTCAFYEIYREDGSILSTQPFGLHLDYQGTPSGLGVGCRGPRTLNKMGAVLPRAEVEAAVREGLAALGLPRVTVVQKVYGSSRDGLRIEFVAENRWEISR